MMHTLQSTNGLLFGLLFLAVGCEDQVDRADVTSKRTSTRTEFSDLNR